MQRLARVADIVGPGAEIADQQALAARPVGGKPGAVFRVAGQALGRVEAGLGIA